LANINARGKAKDKEKTLASPVSIFGGSYTALPPFCTVKNFSSEWHFLGILFSVDHIYGINMEQL
jgi:hypothetical protein